MATLLPALIVAAVTLYSGVAYAERSTFRTYDFQQGLASVDGTCMLQDPAGDMLTCTEHGVFAFDGKRFVNLGTTQGLPEGGEVTGLAMTAAGRVAVSFADEVFVADRPSDAQHPTNSLSFGAVRHAGVSFYDERPHRLASWQGGFALIAGDTTVRIVVPSIGPAHVDAMGYSHEEQKQLEGAAGVFVVRGHLWEAFDDGRLCVADPGAVRCYAAADGLGSVPWVDVVGVNGTVLARSAKSVATLSTAINRWSVVDLPDQGGRYDNNPQNLGLFPTPDGQLLTQADHGIAVLGRNGWQALSVDEGAPSGTVTSAVTDSMGQLWFHILGRGLVRWVGYGRWEAIQKTDGLSDNIAWESVRPPGGALWVSTDTGTDEISRHGRFLQVSKVIPGGSFALAVGPGGRIWSGSGTSGVKIISPVDGSVTRLDTPPVDVIVPVVQSGCVWLGTEKGLFKVNDHTGVLSPPILVGVARLHIADIVRDGAGGVFYLAGGRLRHQHADGADVSVGAPWRSGVFTPSGLAMGGKDVLWIAGVGGLFRVELSGDRIVSAEAVPTSDTQTNTVVAVMVDHRGWVWAGTPLGVSVFNGRRWASVDASGGLVSNDVQQGGLREDPDGSVWIATTQGLSHMLDPSSLFDERPLQVVMSQALLGSQPVSGRPMPYTRDALSIQLGTPNFGAEDAVAFRYRLSGVDSGWAESSTGLVRYPSVPPGRHLLTVIGYDRMTHQSSSPATLVVDVGYPWWRQYWSEAAGTLILIGLLYGAERIRLYAVYARQAELKREVATATEQMRLAHEETRMAQARDQLTGLFTRCEVERRLATELAAGFKGADMLVALLDVDHFKRVNDRYGHLGGDDVLRALGRLIAERVRGGEYAGRYGGEEILIVLDDSDGRGAERVLSLHRAIRQDTFVAAGTPIRVTCSIGLAWIVSGDTWESSIGRADDALYEAKERGRDRVAESRPPRPTLRDEAPSDFRRDAD